jgi:uncharacterized phiE125 gp8 family phage protein
MSLVLVTPPAHLPLALAEAKAIAKLDGLDDSEDPVIAGYLRTATEAVENYLGLRLITQTWQYSVHCFPYMYGDSIRLPLAPVQSVDEIRYLDLAGATQVLDADTYRVSGIADVARIYLAPGQSWPAISMEPEAIAIDFSVGCGDDWNSVPEAIRTSIAMKTAALYDGCHSGEAEALMQPHRWVPV